MTTTTPELDRPASPAGVGGVPSWPDATLARELFAELGRLGGRIAALDRADTAAWQAARPALSRLSVDLRGLARELAAARGVGWPEDGVEPLQTGDGVPPVVWAREVAAVHRLVRRALGDPGPGGEESGRSGATLARMLQTTGIVAAEIATGCPGAPRSGAAGATSQLEGRNDAHDPAARGSARGARGRRRAAGARP